MTVSRQPQITEELLSAYLDDQVTAEERALVEAAIATDPAIAWQVDSLRQTVQMLQALPPLTLPRTFTLEALLVEARAAEALAPLQPEVVIPTNRAPRRTVVRTPVTDEPATPWWQWFLQLWQGGNLQLRNATAVALTLFFVLIAGDRFLVSTRPIVDDLPAAAPIVVTSEPVVLASEERTAVEVSTAPAAAEPTATSAPADVAVTTAASSNDQTAAVAAQPENNARQPEGATFAAPGGAPGPVEETLNPEGGASTDRSAVRTFGAPAGGERGLVAKSTTPTADAVAANAVVTQGYAITGETQLTTTLAAPMSGTVTTTAVISVTPTMTPTVVLTSAVLPTVTMANAAPLTRATPTVDEGSAWLTWAQMVTALSTLVLAGLWWRSRR